MPVTICTETYVSGTPKITDFCGLKDITIV